MLEPVLSCYGLDATASVQPFGNGLINSTWKVVQQEKEYILQKINHNVFKKPQDISDNMERIAFHLQKNHPDYFFVRPLATRDNQNMVHIPAQGFFRLLPFVKNSVTYDVAPKPEQAFEAAFQFGAFSSKLAGMPAEELKITLPGFHDLAARYEHFNQACTFGNPERIKEAGTEIDFLRERETIVSTYKKIRSSPGFKLRVTHHDTKISNVLFDREGKGICVIDLDTVMPGYYISDVGDMMRTYLSPVSEEERDLSRIAVREEYFKAIVQGYLEAMGAELSEEEISHFVYAGVFLIYMQAIRFLTDHLNNDSYYGASYEGHNYMRAKNQVWLLKQLLEKEEKLTKIVWEAAEKNVRQA